MLALGIVEKVNSQYSVKVRIPILHRAGGDVSATPTEMLPDATISTFSRSLPNYTVGTVVVVGFDRDDTTSPIVLGELCVDKETDLLPDVSAGTIRVLNNAVLPKSTSIGSVNEDNISALKGAKSNIQEQIDDLERRVSNLEGN